MLSYAREAKKVTQEERLRVFESEPFKKAVLRQAAPAVASQLTALVYGLADTYFVGLLNDPKQTASVTVCYPAFIMLTAISNLVGVGGAAAAARALGAGSRKKASAVTSFSLWAGLLFSLLFTGLLAALLRPALTLLGAKEQTLPLCVEYAKNAILLGGVFTVLSNVFANLFRAEGRALAASLGLSAGGLLNILLDPFFILPRFLGLGAAGAGLATAVSNAAALGVFIAVYCKNRRETVVKTALPRHEDIRAVSGDVLKTGFPSAAQYLLTVVAVAAQARFVSGYGTEAVAALGIVKKLDQLPLYFSIGVSTGLLPLLAFNHAKGSARRARDCFRFGTALSFGFSLLCLVCYEAFAPRLAGIFIDDEKTVALAAAFLRRMVTAMPLMSVCYPIIIRFQAEGRSRAALVCSVLRKGLLDLPLLYLMDLAAPLYGLMWVQPMVDGISLAAALALLKRGAGSGLSADNGPEPASDGEPEGELGGVGQYEGHDAGHKG
ncbi:MAG: MATE family efflux transporter [Clostridia bacterium]|nr:MATE family efflux transporter [Clostridia bacterium]